MTALPPSTPHAPKPGTPSDAGSASGRRWRIIFITVFWSIVAYVGAAVAGSILTELYSRGPMVPETALPQEHAGIAGGEHHEATSRQRTWCIGRLVGLKNQLDRRVAQALAPTRSKTDLHLQHQDLTPAPALPHGGLANARDDEEMGELAPWAQWSDAWRDAVATARNQCAELEDPAVTTAFHELQALHASYDQAITALIASRTVAMQRLRDSLKELRQLSAP